MKRNPAEVPARPSRCVYQLTSHESPVRTNQSPSHPYTTNGRHRYCRCTCRSDYRSSTRAVNRIAIMIYLRLVYHHRVHLAVEAASLKTLLAVASRLLPLDGRRRLRKAAVVAISKCRLSRTSIGETLIIYISQKFIQGLNDHNFIFYLHMLNITA